MDNVKIGNFISELRKEKNMTQKQLAEKLNVTDKAVSKWERGSGYPDITIIPELAKLLGVTASELLQGERIDKTQKICQDPTANMERSDTIVTDLIEYVGKSQGQKLAKENSKALSIVSVLFLTSVFVCILCNSVISKKLDWSLYVVGGEVMAWFFLAPFLLRKKHALVLSLTALTILIVPFLFLLDSLVPTHNVIFPFVFPILLICIVSLWILALLFIYTKIRRIFLVAICFILVGVIDNLLLNRFCQQYFHLDNTNISVWISALSCGFIAVLLFISGISKGKIR